MRFINIIRLFIILTNSACGSNQVSSSSNSDIAGASIRDDRQSNRELLDEIGEFVVIKSFTWSVDDNIESPVLKDLAIREAEMTCQAIDKNAGPVLVSEHHESHPTHTGGRFSYRGIFRCDTQKQNKSAAQNISLPGSKSSQTVSSRFISRFNWWEIDPFFDIANPEGGNVVIDELAQTITLQIREGQSTFAYGAPLLNVSENLYGKTFHAVGSVSGLAEVSRVHISVLVCPATTHDFPHSSETPVVVFFRAEHTDQLMNTWVTSSRFYGAAFESILDVKIDDGPKNLDSLLSKVR